MSKRKEVFVQQIKRLDLQLSEGKFKNDILNTIIDISDKQYGTSIRKKFLPINPKYQRTESCKSIAILLIVWC